MPFIFIILLISMERSGVERGLSNRNVLSFYAFHSFRLLTGNGFWLPASGLWCIVSDAITVSWGRFLRRFRSAIRWGQGWTPSRFADFTRKLQHFINQPPGQYNSVTRSNNCNDNTNCMHLLPFSLDRHHSHSMVMRWRMLDDDENDVHAVDGAASKMFHVWCWKWRKWRKWKMVNDAQW